MLRARVVGTGSYLPEKVMTNRDIEKLCDTSDEWIRQRTGIEERRVAADGDGTSDLAVRAAKAALESAGVDPLDLELIICGTLTPDMMLPANGSLIQGKLGASNAAAYDVNAACSGFMYGLATANAFIQSGAFKTVLLVGSDIQTNRLTWKNRDTSVLFADGAGAVVLKAEEGDRGVLSTYLKSDGANYQMLYVPVGGSVTPINPENVNNDPWTIIMNGPELFKKAVKSFEEAANVALERAGLTLDDVDLFIPHQANARIIETVADRMKLPREKAFINIYKVGNTTHGSIPIALNQAVSEGRIKDGSIVLFASFGGGVTWASAVMRW